MGCNLRDLVVPHPIDLSDLRGERVAIDVFLNAYQFLTSLTGPDGRPLSHDGRVTAHLYGFLDRASSLIAHGIDPVFIFDGRPHDLKRETLKDRRERKNVARRKWEAAVEVNDMASAKKLGPQIAEYTPNMVEDTKRLFDLMGVTWVDAPMEAEGAAAVLCGRGEVSAVASQDWDTLLYGSPTMIRNLTAHGTRKFGRVLSAERIELDETLETLGIDMHQFVDLGIMIGTDFHPGFRGVGPKTGLKLIRNFQTLEKVAEHKEIEVPSDIDLIRELFHNHPSVEGMIPDHTRGQEEGIVAMLRGELGFGENRVKIAIERLASANRLRSSSKPTLFDF
ncbi:MAG: endonuclease [Methanobacteriota archaeon]|nr:MAG: endonuclease [Euryarchaeota archaeon]